MLRVLVASLLALSLLSCVQEGGPERPVTVGTTVIAISFSTAPEELPFNPRGARLTAAGQQLEAALGHPMQLQLDAALVPQWRANFENGLASSLENVARGLASIERGEPHVHAFAVPRLRRVVCRYDAASRFSSATFDDRAGTLIVTSPALPAVKESVPSNAPAVALLEAGHVVDGLSRSYFGPYLERRFDGVEPERVAPDDLSAYWDYLERRRSGYYPAVSGARPAFADDPTAVEIEQVVRFEARVPPAERELTLKVRRRLVESAHFFGGAYLRAPDQVRSAPPGSPFKRAEAAYSAWLQRNAGRLDETEQLAIVRAPLFAQAPWTGSDAPASGRPRYFEAAFPGFDALGFVLGVINRWIAAGHPANPEVLDHHSLFINLICPAGRTSIGTLAHGGSCDGGLYAYALATPTARERLLHALSARHDRPLTETVFLNVRGAATPDLLEMWRAIEPDPIEWRIATLVLGDADGRGEGEQDRALYDEGLRLWRQHPDRRGPVLYLLVSLQQYNLVSDGLVNWTEHERIFGSLINADEYASFLAQGPLAISRAAGLWHALGPGFSRVAPLLPRLDAYITDPTLTGYDLSAPERPLRDIASRLCAEHATADLALLHSYFEKRAATRPSEERRFGLILDITSPGRCNAAGRPGGLR